MEKEQQKNNQEIDNEIEQQHGLQQLLPMEEDLCELGFNRMSSIAHPEVPHYPIVTEEVSTAEAVSKDGKKYLNEYEMLQTLGEGSYGKVRKVKRHYLDKDGNEKSSFYAMKVLQQSLRFTTVSHCRTQGSSGRTATLSMELHQLRTS